MFWLLAAAMATGEEHQAAVAAARDESDDVLFEVSWHNSRGEAGTGTETDKGEGGPSLGMSAPEMISAAASRTSSLVTDWAALLAMQCPTAQFAYNLIHSRLHRCCLLKYVSDVNRCTSHHGRLYELSREVAIAKQTSPLTRPDATTAESRYIVSISGQRQPLSLKLMKTSRDPGNAQQLEAHRGTHRHAFAAYRAPPRQQNMTVKF